MIVLGDESGYTVSEAQQTKMAAIEAMWETEPAPAGLSLFGIKEKEMKNDWQVQVPWVLGLIGTRSANKQLPGIKEIREKNRQRIEAGMQAVTALEALRKTPATPL